MKYILFGPIFFFGLALSGAYTVSPYFECLLSIHHDELRLINVIPNLPDGYTPIIQTERLIVAQTKPTEFVYLDRKTFEEIGIIGFTLSQSEKGIIAHMPIYTIKEKKHLYQGKGFGTEAKYALMKWAFEEKNIYAVKAYIYNDNYRSINMQEKLGFQFKSQQLEVINHYEVNRDGFQKLQFDISSQWSEPIEFFRPRKRHTQTELPN